MTNDWTWWRNALQGTFGDNMPPLVESRSKNYLTMALEEVDEGMLKYDYPA